MAARKTGHRPQATSGRSGAPTTVPGPSSPPSRPLPAIQRLRPDLYYGWIVTWGCAVTSFATAGIGFYGMSVLLDGLVRTRGFTLAEVAGPTSAYFIAVGVAGTVVGRLVDRFGARRFVAAGSIVLAGGLLAVGRVEDPSRLWLIYPVMALGFALSGQVPLNAMVTRWFVRQRARAMSYSHTGVSVGGIVLAPLATASILRFGLEGTMPWLALLLVLVALPLAAFVLRVDPGDHGLEPDPPGARSAGGETAVDDPLLSDAHQRRVWSTREAMSTRAFWQVAFSFGLILFCQQALLMHQIALFGERTGDARLGSLAISLTAGASILGRLVVGSFADRVSKRRLAGALMAIQALALLGYGLSESVLGLAAAAALLGLTLGSVFMMQALVVGELFGMVSFGAVFGALQLLTQIAGGLGPVFLAWMHAADGGYERGLLLFAALAGAAALVIALVQPPPAAAEPAT